MNTHFDQQYIDSLKKLQNKGEVSDEEYENLRSSWIMNSQLTDNEIIAIEKRVSMGVSVIVEDAWKYSKIDKTLKLIQ